MGGFSVIDPGGNCIRVFQNTATMPTPAPAPDAVGRERTAPAHPPTVGSGGRSQISTVDRMWQNPNRIHTAQGPIVTLTAVRRRLT
ncbi:hypothetical protein Ari01nite_75660 [Paractinoplanes rishiriensis]|uniref:Uncharacterized protein n=1 Tax=Paractinoplanes rishiriensis TaxID=1050105 RepID=A0A919MU92_9ACTN|nr:hypothetical protein Ari01nite_75660 [Actinoplanes rishiriensis]